MFFCINWSDTVIINLLDYIDKLYIDILDIKPLIDFLMSSQPFTHDITFTWSSCTILFLFSAEFYLLIFC